MPFPLKRRFSRHIGPLLRRRRDWHATAFVSLSLLLVSLWLAWQAYVETGSAAPAVGLSERGFRRGFIANLLNPKALVFYVVVIGQFTDPAIGSVWGQILILGGLHLLVAALVHIAIVYLGTRLGEGLEAWRTSLSARLFFSLSLVAIAVWIAVSTG